MTTKTLPYDHGANFAGPLQVGGADVLRGGTIVGATIDGAGAVLTTGAKKAYVSIPWNCTVTKWRLLPDVSGSVVVDIWKDTYANFPPVNADSITGSAKPTVTTTTKAESSTLTGWTTSLDAGDILEFEVESATTITRVRVELTIVPR